MKYIAGIEVKIEGREHIENNRPGILIGNHQHNFDVLTASKLFTPFVIVLGKFELGLIPYFGQFYVLAGNMLIKRSNREKALNTMEKVYKKLKEDNLSVLIFPEGHRNSQKELLPFKKGAFHTAVSTGFPLIPFAVSQFAYHDSFKAWQIKTIRIKVFPPIQTDKLTKADIPKLMNESKKIIEDGIQELNKAYQ